MNKIAVDDALFRRVLTIGSVIQSRAHPPPDHGRRRARPYTPRMRNQRGSGGSRDFEREAQDFEAA